MMPAWLFGMAAFLLANGMRVGPAQAQTVDSLNVTTDGIVGGASPTINSAISLPNGQMLVGGSMAQFISSAHHSHTNLVLLNVDGSVDDSFNANIIYIDFDLEEGNVNCLALQTNGQILVGGYFTAINGKNCDLLGRLNVDGTLDTSFNAGTVFGGYNGGTYCLQVLSNGQILVGSGKGLYRLNYDGSLDTNFNAGANNYVLSLALQPDGKIVAVGSFPSSGGQSPTNLVRLNADGSLDPGFQPHTIDFQGWAAGPLQVQPDGRILVGGFFDRVDGLSHTNLVRLNADGSLDPNFTAQADWHNCFGVGSFALQTDGKMLVGGDSLTLDGRPCPSLGRLNGDGSLDGSFSTNVFDPGGIVLSTALEPDGRMLVGGFFSSIGGQNRVGLGRLSNTCAATQSLNYDGTNLLWLRGGASPEVWRASFEATADGTNWTDLGDGSRVGGGWQLTHVRVATNAMIRTRGFVTGGRYNGSSWFVESDFLPIAPILGATGGNPGFQNRHLGFSFSGSIGSTVVIDASSNLLNWLPLVTNVFPSGCRPFNDPGSTNSPRRFYRARWLPGG